jgi:hypothetical protein
MVIRVLPLGSETTAPRLAVPKSYPLLIHLAGGRDACSGRGVNDGVMLSGDQPELPRVCVHRAVRCSEGLGGDASDVAVWNDHEIDMNGEQLA